jgi:hypothetical protein
MLLMQHKRMARHLPTLMNIMAHPRVLDMGTRLTRHYDHPTTPNPTFHPITWHMMLNQAYGTNNRALHNRHRADSVNILIPRQHHHTIPPMRQCSSSHRSTIHHRRILLMAHSIRPPFTEAVQQMDTITAMRSTGTRPSTAPQPHQRTCTHSLRLRALVAPAMNMGGMDMIRIIICNGMVLGGSGGVFVYVYGFQVVQLPTCICPLSVPDL